MFWVNFWYTDKNYQFSSHIDLFLKQLVYTYIFFGLDFKKNIYTNLFWYPFAKKQIQTYTAVNDLKYFRFVEYRSKIFNEINNVKLRKQKKNTYRSKIWILKYQGWIIINFYMFQPLILSKKKLKQKQRPKSGFILTKKKNLKVDIFWKKYLFVTSFLTKQFFEPNLYYMF